MYDFSDELCAHKLLIHIYRSTVQYEYRMDGKTIFVNDFSKTSRYKKAARKQLHIYFVDSYFLSL